MDQTCSSALDPGVEGGLHQVHRQVQGDEEYREYQDRALQHRQVASMKQKNPTAKAIGTA